VEGDMVPATSPLPPSTTRFVSGLVLSSRRSNTARSSAGQFAGEKLAANVEPSINANAISRTGSRDGVIGIQERRGMGPLF